MSLAIPDLETAGRARSAELRPALGTEVPRCRVFRHAAKVLWRLRKACRWFGCASPVVAGQRAAAPEVSANPAIRIGRKERCIPGADHPRSHLRYRLPQGQGVWA